MKWRIRELALKAGGKFKKFNKGAAMYQNVENDLQDFAELIVRECAEVGLDSVENGDDLDAIMKRVHNNILTHFGVEE